MKIDLETYFEFLKGNICRLAATEDIEELTAMYAWAVRRLTDIYFERRKEIETVENCEVL